jgi:hypothetical protein
MTLARSLIVAVARAVEKRGGDMDDVADLLDVWERLARDPYGRLDRVRAENEKRQKEPVSEEPGG